MEIMNHLKMIQLIVQKNNDIKEVYKTFTESQEL